VKDDPIREYLERDIFEERFHEANKRLQMEIDRNQGWDREAFKKEYTSLAGMGVGFGLARAVQTFRESGSGFGFVRWNGCLWHLLIDVRVRYDQQGRISARWAHSACGESFPVGDRVEGKVDTEPHQALTCSKCWEHVESVRVANILMEDTEDVWRD
jgi:hypothetical protein